MPVIARSPLFALLVPLLLCACEPVAPVLEIQTRSFEGFTVHSSIPQSPVGIVYLFHGSRGSADFALKVETVDQTNALSGRGYGWVATESTERTGDRRWDVFDASIATNPDLARLTRLHDDLVANTGVGVNTPIFGIGMSNGARMVTLFGETFADAGYPVVALAPFMGRAAPSVAAAGGLSLPGFWVTAENDLVVPPGDVMAAREDSMLMGVPTEFHVKGEEPLLPVRFTRIPAVDIDEAVSIYEGLRATGAWDTHGNRVLDLEQTIAAALTVQIPDTGATPAQIRNQLSALLGLHQFVGIYRDLVADFFDEQLQRASATQNQPVGRKAF